jgi:uncharacterized membrane protein YbjE (DUF340 family)
MISILLVLSGGIVLGLLLVNKPVFHRINNHLLNWSIYLLLFLLGISVGTNDEVIRNLDKIGYEAITISLASIAGSVLLSALLFKLVFRHNEK